MVNIFFEEDREILKPMEKSDKPPEKGLEAWFHQHSPYGLNTNRYLLILLSLLFFVIAGFFLFAYLYNQTEVEQQRQDDFRSRVTETRNN